MNGGFAGDVGKQVACCVWWEWFGVEFHVHVCVFMPTRDVESV